MCPRASGSVWERPGASGSVRERLGERLGASGASWRASRTVRDRLGDRCGAPGSIHDAARRSKTSPKTASRSLGMASRSEDDAHLRSKALQDRFKTALDPLLTPTWPHLGPPEGAQTL